MINKNYADKVIDISMRNNIPLQLSKLMACQSAVETYNFTSNAFKKNNNGFGYKYYKGSEYQLGKGIKSTENDPYAAYASFDDSIKEVVAWIKRRQRDLKFPADLTKIQDGEGYAHLLKDCAYFGGKESDYAAGINNYLKQLNNEQ